MAFPTTAIIDSFNRPNEGAPMTNWAPVNDLFGSITRGFKVVSNQAENGSNSVNCDYYTNSTFAPNVEVFVTMVARGSGVDSSGVSFLSDPAGTPQGYTVLGTGSVIRAYRVDGDSNHTQLGADISQAFTAGDSIGFARNATTGAVDVWYKVGAGAWIFLDSRTDTTYTSSGRLCLWADGNSIGSAKFKDFGGGTIVTGDAPALSAYLKPNKLRPRAFAPGLAR